MALEPIQAAKKMIRAQLRELAAQKRLVTQRRKDIEAYAKANPAEPIQFDPRLGATAAKLASAITQLSGELRKLETHVTTAVEQMTPEQQDDLVYRYIDQLPAQRLAALRRYLQESASVHLLA